MADAMDLPAAMGDLVAPRAACGLRVLGTVAPWGAEMRPHSISAARIRGVGVRCTFTPFFGEGALCGVAATKENAGVFKDGETGLCSVLTTHCLYSDHF